MSGWKTKVAPGAVLLCYFYRIVLRVLTYSVGLDVTVHVDTFCTSVSTLFWLILQYIQVGKGRILILQAM